MRTSLVHSGYYAGLECGVSGARIVLLSRRDSGLRVEGVFLEEEPFESRSQRKSRTKEEIVRSLLLHLDLTGYKIAFVSDDVAGNCFVLLPRMNRPEAEGALLLQAQKLLSWKQPNPVMAHIDSEYPGGRVGSITALADRERIASWRRIIERTGGVLNEITVRACAYRALALYHRWHEKYRGFLIADIGAASTSFYMFDGASIKFMREISLAGDTVTKAMAGEISTPSGIIRMNEVEAEEYKISGDLKRLEMVMRPVMEKFSTEIIRSIRFFKDNTGCDISAVLLAGGGALLESIQQRLVLPGNLTVEVINPFDGVEFAKDSVRDTAMKWAPRFAVAFGLALIRDHAGISLLPEHVKVLKKVSRYAPSAVAVLLLAGFIPFTVGGIIRAVAVREKQQNLEKYRQFLAKYTPDVNRAESLRAELLKKNIALQTIRTQFLREPLWHGMLNSIAGLVPQGVRLTSISSDEKRGTFRSVVLEGVVMKTADNFDATVNSLLKIFASSPFFKNPRLIKAEASSDENKKIIGAFTIECEIVY